MDHKDIKFNQYYRVKIMPNIMPSGRKEEYTYIGCFIKKLNIDWLRDVFIFYDINEAYRQKKNMTLDEQLPTPDNYNDIKNVSCVFYVDHNDIMSLEEIDEKDLKEELFINGL